MTPAKLAELEEKAKASPEVVFQGGRESDRYYTAANPTTILELIAAYRKAVEALEYIAGRQSLRDLDETEMARATLRGRGAVGVGGMKLSYLIDVLLYQKAAYGDGDVIVEVWPTERTSLKDVVIGDPRGVRLILWNPTPERGEEVSTTVQFNNKADSGIYLGENNKPLIAIDGQSVPAEALVKWALEAREALEKIRARTDAMNIKGPTEWADKVLAKFPEEKK